MSISGARHPFQVVLLAGGTGSRMYPLTEDIPKPLLPIANRPLISYQLEMLDKSGVSDVIVVTNSDIATAVRASISECFKGSLKVSVEVVKGHTGTVDALLKIKDKLHKDFFVISSDIIISDSFFQNMILKHKLHDAAATILLKYIPQSGPANPKEKQEESGVISGDFVGMCSDGRMVFFTAAADLEEELVLHKTILASYPHMVMHNDLLDTHIYLLSHWVLGILQKYESKISSIKGELLPLLIRLQLTKALPDVVVPEHVKRPKSFAYEMSASSSAESDCLGCFAYVLPADSGYCVRVNTIQSYIDANNTIPRSVTPYLPLEPIAKNNFIHESAVIDPKTQIGHECVVGASTTIADKGSVKKANIGKHCKIGPLVKISNSIIMDHVTIKEKCTITNSIICSSVYIGANCNITNCQVGSSYSLEPNSEHKNESLVREED